MLIFIIITTSIEAIAADITVKVGSINSASSQVGCALFKSVEGFLMNPAGANQQWLAAATQGVECKFNSVPAGEDAISVTHDMNGNLSIDTNFFGVPTEAWGVSNNARPLMRAPEWKEAKFLVVDSNDIKLDIKISK